MSIRRVSKAMLLDLVASGLAKPDSELTAMLSHNDERVWVVEGGGVILESPWHGPRFFEQRKEFVENFRTGSRSLSGSYCLLEYFVSVEAFLSKVADLSETFRAKHDFPREMWPMSDENLRKLDSIGAKVSRLEPAKQVKELQAVIAYCAEAARIGVGGAWSVAVDRGTSIVIVRSARTGRYHDVTSELCRTALEGELRSISAVLRHLVQSSALSERQVRRLEFY